MRAGHVVETAVVDGAVVEGDPASQVLHGLRAGPVGVVLVPGDHAAMVCGFAEELVMPETDRTVEQLRGGDEEGWTPQDIVECGAGAPCAEGVEEDRVGIARFVRVVLVEELVRGVAGVHEAGQLGAERFDLIVVENLDAGKESVAVERLHLLVGKSVLLPLGFGRGWLAEGAGWGVEFGVVADCRVNSASCHGGVPANGIGVRAYAGFVYQGGWG